MRGHGLPSRWCVIANHPRKRWRTFLATHMKEMVSSNFFVVPTFTSESLGGEITDSNCFRGLKNQIRFNSDHGSL